MKVTVVADQCSRLVVDDPYDVLDGAHNKLYGQHHLHLARPLSAQAYPRQDGIRGHRLN